MANEVKDIDRGWKKHAAMMRKQASSTPHVKIGVLGPNAEAAHADADMTTIEVATIHEFGRGKNPERSFIRGSFNAYSQRYAQALGRLADLVLTNRMTHKQALRLFGEKAVADMKAFMAAGIPPDKADGNPARLKRTGQLYGSLTYEVMGL